MYREQVNFDDVVCEVVSFSYIDSVVELTPIELLNITVKTPYWKV